MIASILTSLLAFVGVLSRGNATIGAVHALLGPILQLRGNPGNHAGRVPPSHQLLHFDGCMSRHRMRHSMKFLGVGRLFNRTAVDEDVIALCHHLQGLTQGMPHHLLHDLLPNAHAPDHGRSP